MKPAHDSAIDLRGRLRDAEPQTDTFLNEVLRGLREPQKELPCRFFYDERGSCLFERICELDEYYLTRTELTIMRDHASQMAGLLGPNCILIEYGSGSSTKTRSLLDHLETPTAYIPIDISRGHLLRSAGELAADYPGLDVTPVCADFAEMRELLVAQDPGARRVVYFPGSTIGNFEPMECRKLLARIARLCGRGGALLIGVDLQKDVAVLEAAYNDAAGITREFNLNLLRRINRELHADFQLDAFEHSAFYNSDAHRIEMHLVSLSDQTVTVGGTRISFRAGETIHTENSHKYTVDGFRALAATAGLGVKMVWTDRRGLFSVQYLTVDHRTVCRTDRR